MPSDSHACNKDLISDAAMMPKFLNEASRSESLMTIFNKDKSIRASELSLLKAPRPSMLSTMFSQSSANGFPGSAIPTILSNLKVPQRERANVSVRNESLD